MKVYKSDNTPLPILTNGEFCTTDNPSYNRHDANVNDLLILELDSPQTVDKLNISAGNAAWGGTEMPKDLTLSYYDDAEPFRSELVHDNTKWTDVDVDISYAAPNGCNDKNAAEMQTFMLPPVAAQYFRLNVRSNWGNGTAAVFRQISLEGAPSTCHLSIDHIYSLCSDISAVFSELENDKDTVDNCRTMLQAINEKGVNVSSVFTPLEAQSNNIQSSIDNFKTRLEAVCDSLAELLEDMRTEASKVGPLDQ